MPIIAQLIMFVIQLALTYLLTPKPKTDRVEPSEKIEIPNADEGRIYPKLYGTAWFDDPTMGSAGDVRTVAIKSKGGKK